MAIETRERKTFSGVGRPRKPNVPRYDSGRIVRGEDREKPGDVVAIGLANAVKHRGAKPVSYRDDEGKRKVIAIDDPRWNFALGRLRIAEIQTAGEGLTEEQYQVAGNFIRIYVQNARIRGWPSPNLASHAAMLVARALYDDREVEVKEDDQNKLAERKGEPARDELEPDEAPTAEERRRRERRVRELRAEWEAAYRAIMSAQRDFGPLFEAVKTVCIEDRDPTPAQLGALRIALNTWGRLWR